MPAMKGISTGLGDVVHNTAQVAAVFGAEIGDDLQFSNSVLVAEKDIRTTNGVVIIILAIELEIIGARPWPLMDNSAPLLLLKPVEPAKAIPGTNSASES